MKPNSIIHVLITPYRIFPKVFIAGLCIDLLVAMICIVIFTGPLSGMNALATNDHEIKKNTSTENNENNVHGQSI